MLKENIKKSTESNFKVYKCACANNFIIFFLLLSMQLSVFSQEKVNAYPPEEPQHMMKEYLLKEARQAWQEWKTSFEGIETSGQIERYQEQMRERFLEKLGGFPERTNLNPKITGTLRRPGYRVEKVLFESQPGFHVSSNLFLPDSSAWEPPYPGVLVPCGHAMNGKAHDTYQSMGALLALNGMVALVFDPVDQGERMQLLDENGEHLMWGTKAHTMAGIGCILLGINTATYEIWDGMRGIDYLQSRQEVDPERIGCTGNSGGGTQTAMLMALDKRIKAAAPSCYINHVARQLETATGDAEQNISGQLGEGPDHADFIMMRAPSPVLICAATYDFFDINAAWETFRFAKRRFTMMGHAEKVSLMENNAGHNYNTIQREAVVRWMARWLQNRVETIVEPDIQLFTDEELRCTPEGQVILLPGERSIYELNGEMEEKLMEQRNDNLSRMSASAIQKKVRETAGISPLADISLLRVVEHVNEKNASGTIRQLSFIPEPGIWLPAVSYVPEQQKGTPVIMLHEEGKKAVVDEAEQLMLEGRPVLTVDLRGNGETKQSGPTKFGEQIGNDWEDYYKAYVLGKTYVGMRAEDILNCARWLCSQYEVESVELRSSGNIGVPALHAAAVEPQLFSKIEVDQCLNSWKYTVLQAPTYNQLINTVHGALRYYDLPDLRASLKEKISFTHPLDAQGNHIE